MMLGDAGTDNSDVSYTGEVSDSTFSLDYARQKGREFQALLVQLDAGYNAALFALNEIPDLDEATKDDLFALVSEFESRRFTLKATAEAFNAGAAAINAMGGRMPELSIPSTLGFLPALTIPAALIGAVAAAATLITWGVVWLRGVNDRLAFAQLLDAQNSPESRAKLAQAQAAASNALAAAEESPVSALAGAAKWIALAALGFVAWKAFSATRGGGSASE